MAATIPIRALITTAADAQALQAELDRTVLPWEGDTSHPKRHHRTTPGGREVAIVDRWLGGYTTPHQPVAVGWKVHAWPIRSAGIGGAQGVVLCGTALGPEATRQQWETAVGAAEAQAMDAADQALQLLQHRLAAEGLHVVVLDD